MLEQVFEITSFNSQACLTCVEQIIKHYLKLMSRNCRYCVPDEMVAALVTNDQYYQHAYGYVGSSGI